MKKKLVTDGGTVSQLRLLIESESLDEKKIVKIYRYLFGQMPGVVLVNEDCLQKNELLKAFILLFSEKEFEALTDEDRNKRTTIVTFLKNNIAFIGKKSGDTAAISCSWMTALSFVSSETKNCQGLVIFPDYSKN